MRGRPRTPSCGRRTLARWPRRLRRRALCSPSDNKHPPRHASLIPVSGSCGRQCVFAPAVECTGMFPSMAGTLGGIAQVGAACSHVLVCCMALLSGCVADTSPLCRCWVPSTWTGGWTERATCMCGAVHCRSLSASSCHGRGSRRRTVQRRKPRGRPRGKPVSRPRQTLRRTHRGLST